MIDESITDRKFGIGWSDNNGGIIFGDRASLRLCCHLANACTLQLPWRRRKQTWRVQYLFIKLLHTKRVTASIQRSEIMSHR